MDYQQRTKSGKNIGKTAGAWTAAGLVALALFIFSALSSASAAAFNKAIAGMLQGFLKTLFAEDLPPAVGDWLNAYSEILLLFCGYALLALLVWLAFTYMNLKGRRVILRSFAVSVLFAAVTVFWQQLVPARMVSAGYILADCFGILFTLLCVVLCRWLWVRFPRVFNWEVISYIIFGVLTTIVNIVANGVCMNTLHIYYLISNTIAWVAAVLFAYVVNKLFVFHSHNDTKRQALREFALFIGARVLSFGVDELGMILLYGILSINNGVSKIITNIIVMIMNYFFSKLIIFKNTKPVQDN